MKNLPFYSFLPSFSSLCFSVLLVLPISVQSITENPFVITFYKHIETSSGEFRFFLAGRLHDHGFLWAVWIGYVSTLFTTRYAHFKR